MLCNLQIFSGKVYHPEPPHAQSLFLFPIVFGINYRKRGSAASYIVREVRSVRERERERERYREREREREIQRERERERRKWRHLSSAEIGEEVCTSSFLAKTVNLAKSLALFLAKNLHLSFSPLKWRWVHTFRCQNVAAFETVRILRKIRTLRDRFTSVKRCDRGSKHRKKRSNFRLHRPSSHRENESN